MHFVPSKKTHRIFSWPHLTILFVGFVLFHLAPSNTHAYSTDEVVQAMNVARQANHVSILHTNAKLMDAAQQKAQNMFAEQYFAHTSPSGLTPWSWFKKVGYAYTEAGENLAMDFVDANDVIDGWMNSAPHKKNLLDPRFTDVGVAVVNGTLNGNEAMIVVTEFGRQTAVADTTPAPTPKTSAAPKSVPPTPKTTTPAPRAPVHTATSKPTPAPAPAVTPVAPVGIPSLTGQNQPVPTLTLTFADPSQFIDLHPRKPAVQGAFIDATTPQPGNSDISVLACISLGLSFSLIAGWAAAQKSWQWPTLSTA